MTDRYEELARDKELLRALEIVRYLSASESVSDIQAEALDLLIAKIETLPNFLRRVAEEAQGGECVHYGQAKHWMELHRQAESDLAASRERERRLREERDQLDKSETLARATLHEVRIILYEIREWLKSPAGSPKAGPSNERADHYLIRKLDKINALFTRAALAETGQEEGK